MKKRFFLLLLVFISFMFFSACDKKVSDAEKFKKEYESLNGAKSESGNTFRSISIDKNNPIKYAKDSDIVNMVHDKKTFVVYFGFSKCPWCRSVIPNLLKAASDLNISTIYYVDVLDIRNTMKFNDNGEAIMDVEGTRGYYDLLSIFNDVLSDYTLKNSSGEVVSVGMKRIYAPNIISVIDGEVQGLVTGISEKQTDAYMKLTDEMNQESYNMIKCSIRCVADSKTTCSSKSIC